MTPVSVQPSALAKFVTRMVPKAPQPMTAARFMMALPCLIILRNRRRLNEIRLGPVQRV